MCVYNKLNYIYNTRYINFNFLHVPEKKSVHNLPKCVYLRIISSSFVSFKMFQSFCTRSMSSFSCSRRNILCPIKDNIKRNYPYSRNHLFWMRDPVTNKSRGYSQYNWVKSLHIREIKSKMKTRVAWLGSLKERLYVLRKRNTTMRSSCTLTLAGINKKVMYFTIAIRHGMVVDNVLSIIVVSYLDVIIFAIYKWCSI